ncbi:hypothetical protein [Hymenobacter cellulosilyticus]|uniref:Uncharacterized protein n=1 Tax=Hymenobacter cellulosilyticus TaxID=2932248 RepID=A0A8T9PXJ0_9BACT|nr:hypothetical protein [Hymenobacter cellulosilyticus]UOQ69984.1 hypothetical protein MUN79_14405 [Hymenobacter cellulosilyticus]
MKPEMFITSYGTLEGYSFKAADFMQPLFEAQDVSGLEIRVDLCLHQYYPAVAAGDSPLQQTFGLVLRLSPPNSTEQVAQAQQTAAIVASTPFFDLSTPCPPGT